VSEAGDPAGRPAVFVTVGTDHHPFDRMVDWMERWLVEADGTVDCFIQFGESRRPSKASGESLIPHDEMDRRIAQANVIVCHGGPGTIIDCLRSGTKPIVLPRRHSLGEHVDDHQRRFARRLEEAGYIKVAETVEELGALISLALAGAPEFVADPTRDVVAGSVRRFSELTAPLLHASSAPVKVLFIGGWGRSGSTLLDRLLGQSPDACSVGEMRDIWLRGVLENRRCGCGEPFDSCDFWREVGDRAFGGWRRDAAADLHRLRMRFDRPWMTPLLAGRSQLVGELERYVEATARIYRSIAETSGAQVIIDSTKIPSYAFILRRIPELDLRFVHLVRDSRGVVHSWQKSVARPDATAHPDRMLRYGPVAAASRYLLYNTIADAVRRTEIPYLFARYEDLVEDTRAELCRIASFAALPIDDADFIEAGSAKLRVSHTVDGNPMRFASGTLTIRNDDAWRREMSPRDRRIVATLTAPLLRRYGYAVGP
jgi:UDP-N-acetylglucosamine transferase subunit ALG13